MTNRSGLSTCICGTRGLDNCFRVSQWDHVFGCYSDGRSVNDSGVNTLQWYLVLDMTPVSTGFTEGQGNPSVSCTLLSRCDKDHDSDETETSSVPPTLNLVVFLLRPCSSWNVNDQWGLMTIQFDIVNSFIDQSIPNRRLNSLFKFYVLPNKTIYSLEPCCHGYGVLVLLLTDSIVLRFPSLSE